ncbi:MAG: sulfatase family protein [Armatimonadota bacterium]
MNRITRRQFIKHGIAGAAGLALAGSRPLFGASGGSGRRPTNLLFIHTDQQHFQALSALGAKHVRTPNMDRLVRQGTTFTTSYSANPVCAPARACWYTGIPSSKNGMLSNNHTMSPDVPDLGQWLGARGYNSFYSGKWHIPGRDPSIGFNCLTWNPGLDGEQTDALVSRSAQSFLRSYDGDKPFFLSVGLTQPHDCCYWALARRGDIETLPGGLNEHDLPPLPENFECSMDGPSTMRKHTDGIRGVTKLWSPLQWRYYLWSYYRMVEMVDAEIGRVLDALEDSRFKSDTLVIFTSDHGDGLARRKMVSKWYLYDEAVRVPLVVVPPGGGSEKIDKGHVVSGLDISATLCDYAGAPVPPGCPGKSLRRLTEGKADEWHEFVVSESNITGRMVRTPEYKLITYKDERPELLFDMRRDPLEMTNLAREARYSDVVSDLRTRIGEWE